MSKEKSDGQSDVLIGVIFFKFDKMWFDTRADKISQTGDLSKFIFLESEKLL